MANSRLCSIPDCGKAVHRRGMCNAHYRRMLRHGDPTMGRTARGALPAFLATALSHDSSECLSWPYGHTDRGYGVIHLDGRHQLVHRIVCEAAHGAPFSDKHEAAHSCGNGHLGCCNPRHLSWKTPVQNEADKINHGTIARGERQGSSKLTEQDVQAIRAKSRSAKEDAALYGVSEFTIYKIRRGARWGWLEAEGPKPLAS